MNETAIEARTSDGFSLSGLLVTPSRARATVVWIHGFGVSYDLPQCVRVARSVAARGVAFLAAGLRSQHGAYTAWVDGGARRRFVRAGGWFEVFEESAFDVDAWVRLAASELSAPVVLAGHSFGSLRAAYYLAHTQEAPVDGLVLGSLSSGLRHLEASVAEQAKQAVAAGRGPELLPSGSWSRGFGTDTVSAQTYASWWRVAPGFFAEPASTLAAIACPTFAWYGTKGDVGGVDELDWLRAQLTAAPIVETELLENVTHGYDGGEEMIAAAICRRLPALVGSLATTP